MWLEPQRVVQTPAVRLIYRPSNHRATAAVSLLTKTLYARRNGDTGRDMGLLGFDNFTDAINGGGAGQSGDTFSGGPLSELLNALGIRPHGFGQRMMGERPMANPAYSQPRISTSGPMPPPMGYAGRPNVPMGGGMPAAARPNTIGGISMPGQPTLTPEQIQQLLMALGMMPQAPMSTSPMGSGGGYYDDKYRPAVNPPTSLGYGPR